MGGLRQIRWATGLGVALGVALLSPSVAAAGTIRPNNVADDFGHNPAICSLREAVQAANTNASFGRCHRRPGPDAIVLQPGATYYLTETVGIDNASGSLDVVSGPLTISVARGGAATIDANRDVTNDRALLVSGGASLSGSALTLRNGHGVKSGGAVGVFGGGKLSLTKSTLSGNVADESGGAIANIALTPGTVKLKDVTIRDNEAGLNGGGMATGAASSSQLTNVTVSGNTSPGAGGGLSNSGVMTLSNVTVADNTADSDGNDPGNSQNGGGVRVFGGTLSLRNTLIGDNADDSTGGDPVHPDCSGTLSSLGRNLIESTTGCTVGPAANLLEVDPKLAPLANNGGATKTHALRAGSLAINAGNPGAPGSGGNTCAKHDQRGVSRTDCDIGGYERVKCMGRVVNRVGTPGADLLLGTPGGDGFLGLAGRDTLKGRGGPDSICAGRGNDTLVGGRGNDRLNGQAGDDTCIGGPGVNQLRSC